MTYIISKPTRRELDEKLRASARGDSSIRGRTRTSEEAFETARRLQRESGEAFVKPFAVVNDSPEARQAKQDEMLRYGRNPENPNEALHG